MAYITGTAQDERDLLDKLNTFLTSNNQLVQNGQAWTAIFDRTLAATPTTKAVRQIVWKATGTGVEQDIYLAASTANSIQADTYNLNFWGATYFNADLVTAESVVAGLINPSPGVVLFADARAFEYHIVATGRCCKIVTRLSQVCSSAYLGFILPTVPPSEYPYPLCVAGSAPIIDENKKAVMVRYSDVSQLHSNIVDAQYGNFWLLGPDQAWRDFYGSDFRRLTPDSIYQKLYPLCNYKMYTSYTIPFVQSAIGATIGGSYPLYPVELLSTAESSQGANRWGALDGIYWVPGLQRATGDVVAIGDNRTGIVFSNGAKTSTRDYFVLETTTEY